MLRTTFAVLLALTAPTTAQVTGSLGPASPLLKRSVTVTSEVVRIGDLVDNAGAAAQIDGVGGHAARGKKLEPLRPDRTVDEIPVHEQHRWPCGTLGLLTNHRQVVDSNRLGHRPRSGPNE